MREDVVAADGEHRRVELREFGEGVAQRADLGRAAARPVGRVEGEYDVLALLRGESHLLLGLHVYRLLRRVRELKAGRALPALRRGGIYLTGRARRHLRRVGGLAVVRVVAARLRGRLSVDGSAREH